MPVVMKTEGGRKFRASAYLVVPDAAKPSTWKLRVEEEPGKVTAKQLGLAAAALSGGGLMGNKVELTTAEFHDARRRLQELYAKLNLKAPESLAEALSFMEMHSAVRRAIQEKFAKSRDPRNPEAGMEWIDVEVFPGYAIFQKDVKFLKQSYTLADGKVALDGDPVEVQKAWVEVQREALVEALGGERVTETLTGAIEGATLEEADGQAPVLKGVTLIRAGESANRRRYSADVLRRDGPTVFEACPAYVTNHNPADKTIRNLVGAYKGVRFDEGSQALKADLHIIEANRGLVDTALQAAEMLGADRIGLSIDTAGSFAPAGRGKAREVERLYRTAQTSVDLVVNPAAGGRLSEAVGAAAGGAEGDAAGRIGEDEVTEMLEAIRRMTAEVLSEMGPAAVKHVVGDLTEAQIREANPGLADAILEKLHETGGSGEGGQEDRTNPVDRTDLTGGAPGRNGGAAEAMGREAIEGLIQEQAQQIAERIVEERLAADAGARLLESRIGGLSPLEQEIVRGTFRGRTCTEAELTTEIQRVRDLAGRQNANRPGVPGVSVVTESLDIARGRLEAVISRQPVKVGDREVEPFRRFSEAVCAFRPEMAQLLVRDPEGFAREALGCFTWGGGPLDRASESVETGTFSHAWADALNRVLVQGPSDPNLTAWRQLVSQWVSFRDLTNTYKLVQVSEIGTFPTVNAGGVYQEIGTYNTDRQQTLSINKKGGLYAVTYEAILLDDIGVLRDIPRKIELAWNWTVADVVFAALQGSAGIGPTMAYDGKALYHSDHGNLGSTAYSGSALKTARLAMKKQADPTSGKRRLYTAKYLCYALDLEEAIWEDLESTFKTGLTTNIGEINVPNFIRERLKLEPIEVDYPVATTTRWELVADPAVSPTLAVGFLFGRQTPNVVIADQETSGSRFTADQVVYKVSGTVGAAPIEHRALYRGNA